MNQITCIIKQDRYSPYESIQHVGGINSEGKRFLITQKEAISYIDRGTSFFVLQNGHKVGVITSTSRSGNKYIKTIADHDTPDNLLSLVTCTI